MDRYAFECGQYKSFIFLIILVLFRGGTTLNSMECHCNSKQRNGIVYLGATNEFYRAILVKWKVGFHDNKSVQVERWYWWYYQQQLLRWKTSQKWPVSGFIYK